ncbi:hypothetical protein C2845_PM16G04900 [Panicum miliaceum]|uniref:Uncharacterized protein n=1 Tax=Panicum miliaceum TaxID=4540 RepID=A0A3L6PTI2_PANMI|nr:hypothetical protein C2845_PM16G04900 [Panicum miliaceum]
MAPKTNALTILVLLVVSLVFADRVKCQQLDGSQGQELVGDDSGGGGGVGVSPKNDCDEEAIYHGPCVEVLCAAACLLQMNRGGHCKGGFFGACMCFVCS